MNHFLRVFFFFLPGIIFSQQTEIVDFKKATASIALHPENETLEGEVVYTFEMLKNVDSIYLDAKNMQFFEGKSDSKIELRPTEDKLWLVFPFQADQTYSVAFSYETKPEQSLYFVGWDNPGSNQIWTQGQGKKTSHWLPSIDDYNEKIEFDLSVVASKGYRVIANGKLISSPSPVSTASPTVSTLWKFDMQHPMSSYLVALAVGDYQHTTIFSKSGVPIKLFYEAKDSLKVEPTYRYTKRIFDFLEKEIGVPFPWETYKQVPVRDFLYAGMENTTLTIFSEAFVIDSTAFIDRNYVNVNAHELAHQWFGDFVTQASGKHHWLQEGFATYYALLAEKEIFGEDYYYFKLYQSAERLKARSDKGNGESLLDPEANSLTFYQKGAWALHILQEKIGDEAFRKAVKTYLQKNAYKSGTTSEFISAAEKSSGMDLIHFVNNWLKQSAFQANEALNSLKKSNFMLRYMELAALRGVALQEKKVALSKALDFPVDDYLGQEVVFQLSKEPMSKAMFPLYKKAFASNNLLTRQAIASSMNKIPSELKQEYESLLQDNSYLTQEKALLHLWTNFPEKRKQYLTRMKNVVGFPDKNIKLLWLTLNLATKAYEPQKKQEVYAELSGYTASRYAYPIRQNAFGYLYQLHAFQKENYKDLLQASFHKVWRFRKFSRQLLEKLLQDETHRKKFRRLRNELPKKQAELLNQKLKE